MKQEADSRDGWCKMK